MRGWQGFAVQRDAVFRVFSEDGDSSSWTNSQAMLTSHAVLLHFRRDRWNGIRITYNPPWTLFYATVTVYTPAFIDCKVEFPHVVVSPGLSVIVIK